MALLAVSHLVFAAAMAATIWFVQLVHYPLYRAVPAAVFTAYHTRHLRRARLTLGLPVLAEAILAATLAYTLVDSDAHVLAWISFGLLASGLLVTATAIESTYRRLTDRFEESRLRSLLRWNLLRAVIWSIRVVFSGAIVLQLA